VTGGENGRLEVETRPLYRPWLPFWTWEYYDYRLCVVEWWAVAASIGVPLAWSWRQRKAKLRGFEVTQDAPALSHDRDARK
jgi:hypothetical protein